MAPEYGPCSITPTTRGQAYRLSERFSRYLGQSIGRLDRWGTRVHQVHEQGQYSKVVLRTDGAGGKSPAAAGIGWPRDGGSRPRREGLPALELLRSRPGRLPPS